MAKILFIKTSSLGDVIHHMPAMTEARQHFGDARFTWVVEEAFAPLASPFYDVGHRVSRALHAIDRNRILTGLALGYAPDAELDFGLDGRRITGARGEPYGILLHATARPEKEWPEDRWVALGNALA